MTIYKKEYSSDLIWLDVEKGIVEETYSIYKRLFGIVIFRSMFIKTSTINDEVYKATQREAKFEGVNKSVGFNK